MYTDNPESCKWVLARIDEYLDGELSGLESEELKSHCNECESCGVELELAAAVKDGLEALPMLACPAEVTGRVFDRISSRQHPKGAVDGQRRYLTFLKPAWRPVSVAAAVAAVALMTVFVSLQNTADRSAGELVNEIIQEQPHSAAEVDQALREARFALAVISDAGRRTGAQIRSDVTVSIVIPVRQVFQEDLKSGL